MLAGESSCNIKPHEPVRLSAALRGAEESVILGGGFKRGKALFYGSVRLRGYPQALKRLFTARLDENPSRHKLALAPGVGRDNHLVKFRALQQVAHRLELLGGLRDDIEFHLCREHRQVFHTPALVFVIIRLGVRQGNQMTKRPGYGIFIPRNATVAVLFAAQHTGYVSCNRGFFG